MLFERQFFRAHFVAVDAVVLSEFIGDSDLLIARKARQQPRGRFPEILNPALRRDLEMPPPGDPADLFERVGTVKTQEQARNAG